ncbi:uncharacterized protein IL334_002057 [Kwoniella shivajii]|uniref:Uncharacterized protein n=1 Tax=Kwoniella shivajii TaxID=564305 RepID=A0ABZ1CU04_9TREE|nr:hypothetical protein IL334_002057 [Kwoniella shivajii]
MTTLPLSIPAGQIQPRTPLIPAFTSQNTTIPPNPAIHTNPGNSILHQPNEEHDENSRPDKAYIILEHHFDHHTDRKGRTKIVSKNAYSSVYEANQAAYKVFQSRDGYLDYVYDEDSRTECFSGEKRDAGRLIDTLWIEVKEMKMNYPKIPKGRKSTQGKKRPSDGATTSVASTTGADVSGTQAKKQKQSKNVVDLTRD